jgi:hypothetical protein
MDSICEEKERSAVVINRSRHCHARGTGPSVIILVGSYFGGL